VDQRTSWDQGGQGNQTESRHGDAGMAADGVNRRVPASGAVAGVKVMSLVISNECVRPRAGQKYESDKDVKNGACLRTRRTVGDSVSEYREVMRRLLYL
jgi:hypothetical protein